MKHPIDENHRLLGNDAEAYHKPSTITRRRNITCAMVITGMLFVAVHGPPHTPASSLAEKISDHSFVDPPASFSSVRQNTDLALSIDIEIKISTGAAGGGYYSISWEPEGSPDLKLWTTWKPLEEGHLHQQLFRVRPKHYYIIVLYTVNTADTSDHEPNISASTRYYSGSSGIWKFDEGPLGKVHGDPNWDLVLIDSAVGKYPDSGFMDVNFSGPIAMDKDGFVVWFYNSGHVAQVTTQMISTNEILLIDSTSEALQKFKPSGELVANHSFDCNSNSLYGYRAINHEIREDSHNEGVILTLVQRLVRFGGLTFPQLVDGIGIWKPHENGIKSFHIQYWLDDYFDIKTARSKYSNAFVDVDCTGGETYKAQDWSHANSVDATKEAYIVSLRSLSVVAAFAKEGYGHGLQWVLTSSDSVRSNFTFVPESGRFYNQHDVTVVGYSEKKMVISLMDNGDLRPGCDTDDLTKNCYSRGAEYELDFEKMTCTLIWEFRPERLWHNSHLFSTAKGSVGKITNDSRLVAFTAIIWDDETTKQKDDNSSVVVYEIDHIRETPHVRSMMTVPSDLRWFIYPYRAVPITHISGETSDMPTIQSF